MIAIPQTQEFVLICEEASKIDCKVVSFTTRVAKINTIVVSSQLLTNSFRVFTLPLTKINRGSVCEFTDLI
jgi:hypothetical protein